SVAPPSLIASPAETNIMLRHRIRQMELLLSRLSTAPRRPPTAAPRPLQTAQDVIDILQEQLDLIRADTSLGTIDKARAVAHLGGVACKAIDGKRRPQPGSDGDGPSRRAEVNAPAELDLSAFSTDDLRSLRDLRNRLADVPGSGSDDPADGPE